jgi:putative FmdB family regulatory protein
MPVYEYHCVDCGESDRRVGALDDQTAICAQCGSLMLRLDEDVFQPYFDNRDGLAEVSFMAKNG